MSDKPNGDAGDDGHGLMTRAANHRLASVPFERKFGRPPLPPHHPDARINDVIYDRMIDPHWSAQERAFVDKQTAKVEAQRRCPDLHIPETLAVIRVETLASPEDLFDRLRPFIGTDALAKPTHASGGVTFLRDLADPAALRDLYDLASMDYASILREMQYWRLPRKIIVETMIPTHVAGPPDDYKFHCIHGEPLLCQIDHGRFGQPWSRLFRVPHFDPMDEGDGLSAPDGFARAAKDRLERMIAAARALSAPFAFVRVDLYDGRDGIYFGELTFTPAASLGIAPSSAGVHRETATHRIYSRILMDALRRAKQAP
ncbi:hypothetical protein QE363_002168 [Sphingomonas sp. SORGH_AS870]|nr:hypothetical protein [Sphingomonas sp. SORGH_AS_0870]